MSSMRNVIQRRNHKERAQPKEREKWGLLEKHKDYSLRAKDYNEKKRRLQILKQKALERNPDEFHFGMMRITTRDNGQRIADRGNQSLSQDVVKLLKTQDAGYLRTVMQRTKQLRLRAEQALVLQESRFPLAHSAAESDSNASDAARIIFVDTIKEQNINASSVRSTTFLKDPAQQLIGEPSIDFERQDRSDDKDDAPGDLDLVSITAPKPKDYSLRNRVESKTLDIRNERNKQKKRLATRRNKLCALKQRENNIFTAEQEIQRQKDRLSSSVGGLTKAGFKYKTRERKR